LPDHTTAPVAAHPSLSLGKPPCVQNADVLKGAKLDLKLIESELWRRLKNILSGRRAATGSVA